MSLNNITSWDLAKEHISKLRAQGKTIVSTNGCFDILHVGHISYLDFARKQGDFLIVGINSDASVKKLKGEKRPINTAAARATLLNALKSVDMVCEFSEETPLKWLSTIQPDIHIKGSDYKIEALPETPLLKSWGAKVVLAPFVDGYSTTALIKTLEK